MSWTASLTIPKGTTYAEAGEMLHNLKPQGQDSVEAGNALRCAALAAETAIAMGVVTGNFVPAGHDETPMKHGVSIQMGGHANPDHEQVEGWSRDGFSFSIWQTAD